MNQPITKDGFVAAMAIMWCIIIFGIFGIFMLKSHYDRIALEEMKIEREKQLQQRQIEIEKHNKHFNETIKIIEDYLRERRNETNK